MVLGPNKKECLFRRKITGYKDGQDMKKYPVHPYILFVY